MTLENWKGRRHAASFRMPRVCLAGYPLILVVALLGTLALFSFKHKARSVYHSDTQRLKWNSFWSSVQFHPTVEIINKTEIIWQIPDSARAVLFLAHGCNGRAANFWDRSPSCQNCVGLPEERLIALQALHQKYAILTISSSGRCWSFGKEERRVQNIIQWWVAENKLQELPLLALGASSGGYFVSSLAKDMKFSSIVLMISEGVFDSMSVLKEYPPTLFVHMPKDRVRNLRIKLNMESLRKSPLSG
ncbi:secretion-regulating guanine nucleotide exchange factor isoform X2 [Wolffia australiana]